mmetsp:Transcript_33996/g.109162  ORF Transcript_33996/g.109162 Transcript_33996/m.109162 type:complete len:395 (+) Transcript_33996:1715-2899(+)
MPLVGGDGARRDHVPRLGLAVEERTPPRVEAQPVLAPQPKVELAQHDAAPALAAVGAGAASLGGDALLRAGAAEDSEREGRAVAKREHRRRPADEGVQPRLWREGRPRAADCAHLRRVRQRRLDRRERLAPGGKPAAPPVQQRRPLDQVLPVELLLADQPHRILDWRAQALALVHAPVANQVLGECLVGEGIGRGERLDLRRVERALPERALRDVALKVVRRRVATQVCAEQRRRRQVGLLRAACDVRRVAAVDVDAHELAVVRAHDRVPLAQRDHVRRRDDPWRHLALKDDVPLRVEPYPVLSAHAAVELGEEHLVAVPLRRSLLVARRLDWLRVWLAVEVDLCGKGCRLAKREAGLRALQEDVLGLVEVAELQSLLVARLDHARRGLRQDPT